MADHGLTGTHHLDGSMCTRTDSCPWSAKDYMASLQGKTTLPAGPGAFGGDVTKVFEAIANMPVVGSMPMPPTPVPVATANNSQYLPTTGALVQEISDALASGAPMTPKKEVPVSHNPITCETLRFYWPDANLTDEQRALMDTLDDDVLEQALDEAFLDHQGQYEAIEVAVLAKATNALVKSLPDPNSAPVGTQDECLNCGLPITFQDNPPRWSDDIMGTTTCDRMRNLTGHSPKEVLSRFKAAMIQAAQPKQATDSPLLFVLTTEGSDREDASVHYARYLLVDAPEADRAAVGSRIAYLLDGESDGHGLVSFTQYNLQAADEAFMDTDQIVKHLAAGGWKARVVNAAFVIRNEP